MAATIRGRMEKKRLKSRDMAGRGNLPATEGGTGAGLWIILIGV